MKTKLTYLITGLLALTIFSNCIAASSNPAKSKSFAQDKKFLQNNTDAVILSDSTENSQVIIIPEYQGRVMTSTADGNNGASFGWINYDLISSKKFIKHMNAFGGEDRFWMGPEGGQFGLYFSPKSTFDVEHWQVPAPFDTDKYQVISKTKSTISLQKKFSVTNYTGTDFDVNVVRKVTLLSPKDSEKILGVKLPENIKMVGYETNNKVTNVGKNVWKKDSGLLSIWILGNFAPSEGATVILPIKEGSETALGKKVNVYSSFGDISTDRLVTKDNAVFFKADGKKRSKIGLSQQRAKDILGSYDSTNNVLTIVKYNKPEGKSNYVNSMWEIQKEPFSGDVVNSYNDGPMADGSKQLGPFYELETSSPALALKPNQSFTHVRYTFHFTGDKEALNTLAKSLLGVSVVE